MRMCNDLATAAMSAPAAQHTATTDVPTVIIQPGNGVLIPVLGAVWAYRELFLFFVWREIKVRYKQTLIGVAWAVLQPIMTMVIFTVVFDRFAKVPSDGLPYPIFAFTALLPWTYFSQAVTQSSASVVGDANLIRKVYFPRLVLPLAAVAAPLMDFLVAFSVLLGMSLWYGIIPSWRVLALPAFLVLALTTALAIGLWLSALNVRYRDVRYTIPFLLQLWMYASPIAYPLSLVPQRWRWIYGLNPMVGTIEGFRWGLLGGERLDVSLMGLSLWLTLALLVGGLFYFTRTERSFADII